MDARCQGPIRRLAEPGRHGFSRGSTSAAARRPGEPQGSGRLYAVTIPSPGKFPDRLVRIRGVRAAEHGRSAFVFEPRPGLSRRVDITHAGFNDRVTW